uniref:Uncharacterized protein n=1 Tax=Aegilops tauschii subsp. strangulata TaxID=200361 RepID=A0A453IWH3_AEGTS
MGSSPVCFGRAVCDVSEICRVTGVAGAEASPFDNYVKKKKLEPLETYVPAVLLTQDQFRDLGEADLPLINLVPKAPT